jgi:bifunctional non-homologous end joining protein LigD
VDFTHLDRVFFPNAGYTKGDLLEYYLHVAPYLLPHIYDRPLTLERWPEGVQDGSFFQKDASSYFPSWLRTFAVERKDGQKTVHYPVVEDEADLLYLVNQGTLTFHTQMSRTSDPDHPDLMVLDVDPPDAAVAATSFRLAARVAALLRAHLQEAGFDPVVKTSGKRGVHLAFRLVERLTYAEARSRLHRLFSDLAQRYPDLLTTHIRKERRRGRVYLDTLRMSEGATIVPPYVVRATPEATVSTPVSWEELEELEDGRSFTIKTIPGRLARVGDLWGVLIEPERSSG